VDILTVGSGLLAAGAALPALDAFLRWRRLAAARGGTRALGSVHAPGNLLVVIPSRAEGERVGDLPGDVRREISSSESGAPSVGGGAVPGAPRVDVLVILDGPDPEAEARLTRDGVHYLSKKSPGPSKGYALAFLAEDLGARLDDYSFILVFDADMRLAESFLRDLAVPEGTDAFQLPVRPSGVPAPGAPRVEALSLAEALADDLARDAAGLPVRLRGKAMGFSPRAFRLGPARATATTAEDSEATLALLARGTCVRALEEPWAFDSPPTGARAMGRSRARWFGGHLKMAFVSLGNLLRSFSKTPLGTFVLAADLWFRPRILLLGTLAVLAVVSDALMLVFASNGAWGGAATAAAAAPKPVALLVCLLLLSLFGKLSLAFEWLSVVALRQRIGYPPEVPAVSAADLSDSFLMWLRAAFRGAAAPSRWHRARPEA
jgi:hypothetical protein